MTASSSVESRPSPSLPSSTQVVIIGGGVIGCSLAYHLTLLGCAEVLLLERRQFTSGTTWHAAGLVGQLRATKNMTRLAQYTSDLYAQLEAETGMGTGFKQNGSISVATDAERLEELRRGASMAKCFGLDVQVISAQEAAERHPLLNIEDVVGAVFLPKDGQTNPVDVTLALAKGARMRGATLVEEVEVTGILKERGRAIGVQTSQGDVRAEVVVNCAGLWARRVGQMAGVSVPLHAAEHFYIVTEPMGVPENLPVLRDPGGWCYYKEEAGKLLVGCFEPKAKPRALESIPEDFAFGHFAEDWEHFGPVMEKALHRIPRLETAGIQLFFNGPESFTPDDRYLLGPAPELKNFFVAAGFNSIGIQSGGGAGKVLAEWILQGHPPMELWDVDLRRMQPFQSNARYLHDRTVEGLGLLYAMHWPYRQPETARGVRRSVLHDRLASAGACFGEAAGWERANWFAPEGVAPRYEYTYGRQNWFTASAAEHQAVREAVGLFDQSSFSKFLVQGRDAERALNRICANDVAVPPGTVVYTAWLNERGTFEADLTVTRLEEQTFLVVSSVATQTRDRMWLERNIPEEAYCTVTDVTSGWATLSVMGPHSRDLLSQLTPADLSNAHFPFGTAQEIEIGYAKAWALRVTYVGELGWELYLPTEFAQQVFDMLVAHGPEHGLRLCGYHALNSLRLEKGYRHFGHDIADEDTPLHAGLGFAVAWDKPGGFLGREALLRVRKSGPLKRRLVQLALQDPEPLLYHNEPVWLGRKIVGETTSGMYGHTVGACLGMGYLTLEEPITQALLDALSLEVEVAGTRHPVRASLRPFYDPKSERVRA